MEISDNQLISSAIFVILGSTVFYISSLVSGTNIFKEDSPHIATLVATIMGMILFIISPYPYLFILYNYYGRFGENEQYEILKQFYSLKSIGPFLIIAIGSGILYGSIKCLNLRWLAFNYIRENTGMQFLLSEYRGVTDKVLSCVKRNGKIKVYTKDNNYFCGQLGSFQYSPDFLLELRNPITSYEHPAWNSSAHSRVVLMKDDIQGVVVPPESFNKHFEDSRHTSQAFYTFLTSVGFFFCSLGLYYTAKLFDNLGSDTHVSKTYETMHIHPLLMDLAFCFTQTSLVLGVVATLLVLLGGWLSHQDFQDGIKGCIGCMLLFPCHVLILTTLFAFYVVYLNIFFLHLPITLPITGFYLVSNITIVMFRKKFVLPFFRSTLNPFKGNEDVLWLVLDELYQGLDLNSKKESYHVNVRRIRSKLLNKYSYDNKVRDNVNQFFKSITGASQLFPSLEKDYFNLILSMQTYLRKRKWNLEERGFYERLKDVGTAVQSLMMLKKHYDQKSFITSPPTRS